MRLVKALLIVALLIGGCDSNTALAPEPDTVKIAVEVPETTTRYFIHITDIHARELSNNKWWITLIDIVNTSEPKPEFVVATGDNVNSVDTGGNWRALLDPLTIENGNHYIDEDCQIPIYFCSGNHDLLRYDCFYCTQELEAYETFVGDPMYSTLENNSELLLVALRSGGWPFVRPQDDSVDCGMPGVGIRPADIRFLRSTIDSNNTARTQVILTHHPCVYAGVSPSLPCGTFRESREEFLDICVSRDVELVLSGHIHEGVHRADGDGIWNKDGEPWQDGDGTRFVVTDALKNWYYRKIYLTGTGGIASVGPMEFFGPVN